MIKRGFVGLVVALGLVVGGLAPRVAGAADSAMAGSVTSASPSSLPQGTSSYDVYIQGSGFAHGATVSFGSSGVTVNAVRLQGSTQITANVTVAATAALGNKTITVTNPSSPAVTCGNCFKVSDTPIVQYAGSLPQGAANQTVYVGGANFMPGATVTVPAGSGLTVNAVTYSSPTQLGVNLTVASNATLGSQTVKVTNPATGSPSGTCTCLVISDTPSVSWLGPVTLFGGYYPQGANFSLPPGAAQQPLVVGGANFMPHATVSFGSSSGITVNSVSYESPNVLEVTVTVAGNAVTGARTVTVTNPVAGSPSGSCTTCFKISSTPLVTAMLGPNSYCGGGCYLPAYPLPQGATNQQVQILGLDFMPGAAVSFGSNSGITVVGVSYHTPEELLVTLTVAPGATLGARTATVTNNVSGSPAGSCGTCFVVSNQPILYSYQTSLPQGAANQTLYLAGEAFMPGAQVTVSGTGVTVNSVNVQSANQAIVSVTVSSSAALGVRTVTFTNPAGGSPSASCTCLTLSDTPTLYSYSSPQSFPRGTSDATLYLGGQNFMPGATVSFGANSGVTVNSVSYEGPNELFVSFNVSNTAAVGPRTVTVTNPAPGSPTGSCTSCMAVS